MAPTTPFARIVRDVASCLAVTTVAVLPHEIHVEHGVPLLAAAGVGATACHLRKLALAFA